MSAKFHAEEDTIISGGYDGIVRLWNTRTGQCLATYATDKPEAPIMTLGVCGPLVFAAARGVLYVWTQDGKLINQMTPTGYTDSVAPNPQFAPEFATALWITTDPFTLITLTA